MSIFKRIFAALSITFAVWVVPTYASTISGPFTFQTISGNGTVSSSANLSGTSLTLNTTILNEPTGAPPIPFYFETVTTFGLLPTGGSTEYTVTETITNDGGSLPIVSLIAGAGCNADQFFECGLNPTPLTVDSTKPATSGFGWIADESDPVALLFAGTPETLFSRESATFTFDLITCDSCTGNSGTWSITTRINLLGTPEPATGVMGLAGLGLLILVRRIKAPSR